MEQAQEDKVLVWLDCDPGLDDLMAIVLAASHPRIHLLGISTSPGNSSIENTTQNALDILYNIGKSHIPVIMGSPKPFNSATVLATHMHGSNGLGGASIPRSDKSAITVEGFGYIHNAIMNAPGQVSFVCTGALTNLAILLHSFSDFKSKIKEISIMGGAIGEGNITPAAEFNIYFDPVAAKEVLSFGIPFTMIPLEVTHTAVADDAIMNKLRGFQSHIGRKVVELLTIYKKAYWENYRIPHPPIHDPTAVYYLLERREFQGRKAEVKVDTYPTSLGRTNCLFKSDTPNAFVCQKINVPRFWEVMIDSFARVVPREEETPTPGQEESTAGKTASA